MNVEPPLENQLIQICTGQRHPSPDPVLDPIEAEIIASVCPHPLPGQAWRLSFADGTYRAELGLIVADHHRVVPEAIRRESARGRTKQELLSKVLRKHENASAWLERQAKATEKRIREATIAEETTVSGRARRALRKFCVGLPSKYRYRIAAQVARDQITDAGKIEALVLDAKAEWEAKLARRKAAKETPVYVEPPREIRISTAEGPQRLVRRDDGALNAMLAAAMLAAPVVSIRSKRPPPFVPD